MNANEAEIVLLEFATEERHDRATLDRYLRLHPGLAAELVDVAHELRLAEVFGPSDLQDKDAGAEAAWRQFDRVRVLGETPVPVDPFEAFKGQRFAQLATGMGARRSFLTPFRDRQVDVASIPAGFVDRLARALGSSVAGLSAFLDLPAKRPMALSFKSDSKPATGGKISFDALVEGSSLTPKELSALEGDRG